jgi:hypothetical protein
MAKLSRLKLFSGAKDYKDDLKFDFDVKRERLHLTNGQDTGIDAIYRGDTGRYLSSVSPKYVVTTHKRANDFVEMMLTKQGIKYDIGHTAVAAHGNRFFREFRFPEYSFVPDGSNNTALDGGTKDLYIPTIIASNSYDRSSKLDFYYGGFRFVCANGIVIGDIVQQISFKHNVDPDYRIIADGFLANMEKTIEGFKASYTRLNSEPADVYLQTLMLETFSQKAVELAAAISQGLLTLDFDADGKIIGVKASPQLSAYALLQISTAVATHQVRKFHRSLVMQRQISKVFGI